MCIRGSTHIQIPLDSTWQVPLESMTCMSICARKRSRTNFVDFLAGRLWVISNEAVENVWDYCNDPISVDLSGKNALQRNRIDLPAKEVSHFDRSPVCLPYLRACAVRNFDFPIRRIDLRSDIPWAD